MRSAGCARSGACLGRASEGLQAHEEAAGSGRTAETMSSWDGLLQRGGWEGNCSVLCCLLMRDRAHGETERSAGHA